MEVGELVPVIFNKASPPQHNLIRNLIEYENAVVRRGEDRAVRTAHHDLDHELDHLDPNDPAVLRCFSTDPTE